MAITITTALAANVAAFAPCVIEGTTSRYGVNETQAITAYTSSGGVLIFKLDDDRSAFWEVGDTFTVSGLTGANAVYNGRHNYVSDGDPDTDVLVTDTPSAASLVTGLAGTATRSNDSLVIRADIYDQTPAMIGSVYAEPIEGGAFEIDVAETLQTQLSSIFSLTAGAVDTANASFDCDIELYEVYQEADYSSKAITDAANDQATIAHRGTDVAAYVAGGVQLLNIAYTAGGKILFHFLDTNTIFTRARFLTDAGVATLVETIALSSNDHHAAVYEIPAGAKTITCQVWSTEANTVRASFLVKVKVSSCGKRLYFLNRLGGYVSIEFVDYVDISRPERVDVYAVKSWRLRRLFSVEENKATAAYFDDLVDSPEVYDESGNEVELVTGEVTSYAENLQIEVEIREQRNFISS